MLQAVSEQVLGWKTHELCTHEEQVNVWMMHTCEYSTGSNPHNFWVCIAMCSNVLLELKLTNRQWWCEHGIRAVIIYAC